MKLKAQILSGSPFKGIVFPDLEQLAQTALGVPVTLDFHQDKQLGTVVAAHVEHGFVVAEVDLLPEVTDESIFLHYLGPCVNLDSMEIVQLGVCDSHSQEDVPTIGDYMFRAVLDSED